MRNAYSSTATDLSSEQKKSKQQDLIAQSCINLLSNILSTELNSGTAGLSSDQQSKKTAKSLVDIE